MQRSTNPNVAWGANMRINAANLELRQQISRLPGNYGYRKVLAALRRQGVWASERIIRNILQDIRRR